MGNRMVIEFVLMALVIVFGSAMIISTHLKEQTQPWVLNPFRIATYIEDTKKEKGKIGIWFWLFIASLVALGLKVIISAIAA